MFTGYIEAKAFGKEVHNRCLITAPCIDQGGLGGSGWAGVEVGAGGE